MAPDTNSKKRILTENRFKENVLQNFDRFWLIFKESYVFFAIAMCTLKVLKLINWREPTTQSYESLNFQGSIQIKIILFWMVSKIQIEIGGTDNFNSEFDMICRKNLVYDYLAIDA